MGLDRKEREEKIRASLGHVGLLDVTDKRVATFSRGMRQRLGLAEILMKEAQIAILDEPTSGLDPQATARAARHHPWPQAGRRERAAVVAPARARAERLRPRRTVQSRRYRAHRHGAGARPRGARRRLPRRGGSRRAGARRAACRGAGRAAGRDRRERTAGGSRPIATCGRKRRRPWSGPADACCACRSTSRASRRSTPATSRPTKESAMRREGSALHGFGVVTLKEIADHFSSILRRGAGRLGDGERDRGRQPRHRSDQGEHGRGSVPVPAAVHPQHALAVWSLAVISRAADRDRAGLRCRQRRAQPAHALAHPVAADLSRCAAVRKIRRRPVHLVGQPSSCCGCWSSDSACWDWAFRRTPRKWRAPSSCWWSRSSMPASGSRSRSCSRSCSGRLPRPRWSRSGCGCS